MSVFDALSAGAVDFVKKADSNVPGAAEKFVQELVDKIEIAKSAHLRKPAPQPEPVQRPQFNQRPDPVQRPQFNQRPETPPQVTSKPIAHAPMGGVTLSTSVKPVVIALGASTGGTEATLVVLKQLPKHTPGMVIVQHMPPGFTKMYADRLNGLCQMEVREAKNGDRVERGVALIAPGDLQMQLVRSGTMYTVKCFQGEKVSGHCPSVDVLFHSVANTAGRDAVGIIMTGMGKDGADGLLHMKQKGAFTIGQDRESCVVYGMPMVAFDIGAVAKQAPCENIANVLKSHLNQL
jgi:two-component system chemotaxis response regulator CheB